MKKLLTIALCFAAVGSLSAQKVAVQQAKKLSGKNDKLTEARSLIKEAMSNPETQNDAETYFIAGKIEMDAYDNAKKAKAINPNDASVADMGNNLIQAYQYFLQALPLDQQPNAKGQIKPVVTKDIYKTLASHAEDFFNLGADAFNAKQFYPTAYQAFMTFGDLSAVPEIAKLYAFNPEMVANSYFNAGLSAYSGNQVEESAAAFRKARENGYPHPESYIYEIACWQNIQNDESRAAEAQQNIMEVAQAGFKEFGIEQPVFLNNLINVYVMNNDFDQALAILTPVIEQNPNNGSLLGLRGFVYDRAGNDQASEADYRAAAQKEEIDFETLKNVSKKLLKVGTEQLNQIEGNSAENQAQRAAIKNNYFVVAQEAVERAGSINPNDPELEGIMERIEYAISLISPN